MGMAYWLVKSEPGDWSWDDQCEAGTTPWDGVRNYQAANNLKAMKVGDLAFFYHSVKEKRIVGIVEVVKESYLDPTDEKGKFVCVDMKTVKPVDPPVTLAQVKAHPDLQDIALVRQGRLSVMPLKEEEWHTIMSLSA